MKIHFVRFGCLQIFTSSKNTRLNATAAKSLLTVLLRAINKLPTALSICMCMSGSDNTKQPVRISYSNGSGKELNAFTGIVYTRFGLSKIFSIWHNLFEMFSNAFLQLRLDWHVNEIFRVSSFQFSITIVALNFVLRCCHVLLAAGAFDEIFRNENWFQQFFYFERCWWDLIFGSWCWIDNWCKCFEAFVRLIILNKVWYSSFCFLYCWRLCKIMKIMWVEWENGNSKFEENVVC